MSNPPAEKSRSSKMRSITLSTQEFGTNSSTIKTLSVTVTLNSDCYNQCISYPYINGNLFNVTGSQYGYLPYGCTLVCDSNSCPRAVQESKDNSGQIYCNTINSITSDSDPNAYKNATYQFFSYNAALI